MELTWDSRWKRIEDEKKKKDHERMKMLWPDQEGKQEISEAFPQYSHSRTTSETE